MRNSNVQRKGVSRPQFSDWTNFHVLIVFKPASFSAPYDKTLISKHGVTKLQHEMTICDELCMPEDNRKDLPESSNDGIILARTPSNRGDTYERVVTPRDMIQCTRILGRRDEHENHGASTDMAEGVFGRAWVRTSVRHSRSRGEIGRTH